MRRYIFWSKLVIAIIGLFCIIGCSATLAVAHYSGAGISFDFPASWVVSSENATGVMARISDPKQTSVSVMITKLQIPSNTSAQQAQDDLVNAASPTQIVSATAACSLGGNQAVETYFIAKGMEIRLTSLLSAGYLYSVSSAATPDVFIKNQSNFDVIVNTFQLK